MTIDVARYRGRFAPSPSGPLHFGSLVAALGSYLQAKSLGGQWLLRIEDIDTTRIQPGADSSIMRTLEQFGLLWDQTETYQTERLAFYQHHFNALQARGLVYGCNCSRARIASLGGVYDGYCQQKNLHTEPLAWRLKPGHVPDQFSDLVFGEVQVPARICQEDYIIKRRDGLFAYQLVVVLDDIDQQIGQVIRGADLLEMTTRQQALCTLLGHSPPQYGHLPLAVTAAGFKLSKQNHATDISTLPLAQSMSAALSLLGHTPPAELQQAPVAELLAWALQHWQLAQVPRQREVQISG
ncbi:tRNA glutamyl-Q(34) synthetase GluQRS [Rheinheimera sp.]|uniref:tRNA glutamyl-Q(34) synthetase GluQRS n=1 Tax=Rheinheimera sp. TaxID=1869214 RepID=UPI002FDEC501